MPNVLLKVITCPYCGKQAELVSGDVIYPHRMDLRDRRFYLCRSCDARVGCHKGTIKPLGRLANAELRLLKQQVHAVFDPLWQNGSQSRRDAYRYLADHLGIPYAECHVGFFDEETCRRAIEICKTILMDTEGGCAKQNENG